jgi:hypothetical protein
MIKEDMPACLDHDKNELSCTACIEIRKNYYNAIANELLFEEADNDFSQEDI